MYSVAKILHFTSFWNADEISNASVVLQNVDNFVTFGKGFVLFFPKSGLAMCYAYASIDKPLAIANFVEIEFKANGHKNQKRIRSNCILKISDVNLQPNRIPISIASFCIYQNYTIVWHPHVSNTQYSISISVKWDRII